MSHKAILIDSNACTVKEVTVNDYTDISRLIGCDLFTCVQISETGETVYVDDEGAINGTTNGFVIKGYEAPLFGNGLILGCDLSTGDSKDTALTTKEVAGTVRHFTKLGRALVNVGHPRLA